MRSDNGTECTNKEFQALLIENKSRHETSAPYSPHQNGTAERGWRTLYEMARCLLLESNLPNTLWNYTVQTAAYVRNRCYCRRTVKTPYELFAGKEPNISKMQKFVSVCYAYKQLNKGELDPRCEQDVFVGYDKNSPAYLVYYPEKESVQKHRLVKFTSKTGSEKETQTCESYTGYGDEELHSKVNNNKKMSVDDEVENVPDNDVQSCGSRTLPEQTESTQPGKVTETAKEPTEKQEETSALAGVRD